MDIPKPYIKLRNEEKLELLPNSPGLYFWYFQNIDEIFSEEQTEKLYFDSVKKINGYFLLYIGIAVGQSIKQRITDKHLNSAHVSTLRHSIGVLLANKARLKPSLTAEAGKFALDKDWGVEKRITEYIKENAKISWIIDENPNRLETLFLNNYKRYSFPLNINKNRNHPFCEILMNLRKKYLRC